MKFDDIAVDIALRQYAQPGETTVEEVLRRAANVVRPTFPSGEDSEEGDAFCDLVYQAMESKKFCPGGRILAGAGTEHGNLLNCFVQDGFPATPGTTEYALHLALKLALVTKVGGGNGLNLDPFPPKGTFVAPLSKAFLKVEYGQDDLLSGTFLNLVTGERETRGYRTLSPIQTELLPNIEHTTIKVPDSTEGIWTSAAAMVRLLLKGKNVVLDLSQLRPEGSLVRGSGGTSSGPASFAVEIFDNFAYWASLGGADYAGPVATLRHVFAPTLRVIRQGGVRRGAGMATLSIDHPDIMDFVTAKDLSREAREGDISTFNISVLVNDYFMNTYQMGVENSKELFQKIAEHAWQTGEPGLIYIDTINNNNLLLETEGPILATNPCGEIGLYPGEPCDLGAINVSEFFNGVQYNNYAYLTALSEIQRTAKQAAQYLDRILDVEKSPLPEIEDAIKSKRRIGLGMMGLADALIKLGIPYGSEEAQKVANTIAGCILRGALHYSTSFPENKTPSSVRAAGFKRRNVAVVTVAPTGTTAMVMGTTSGIEPLFSPFIYRRVGTEYKQILHPLFQEKMEEFPPTPEFMRLKPVEVASRTLYEPDGWDWDKIIRAIGDNHGSVQGIQGIPSAVQKVFVCAHDVTPEQHVLMQAAVQRGFDYLGEYDMKTGLKSYAANSISKTINLPNSAKVSDVLETYELGWAKGLKGITVYRDGSRSLQVLNTTMQEDDSFEAKAEPGEDPLQEVIAASCSLEGSCDI
jgi:ribonucleoside-diphosphate reductase alpha chain